MKIILEMTGNYPTAQMPQPTQSGTRKKARSVVDDG